MSVGEEKGEREMVMELVKRHDGRKLKEEEPHQNHNHLSGAYIRRLVKQLSSSKSKSSPSSKSCVVEKDNLFSNCESKNSSDHDQPQSSSQPPPPPQQQHKKQVRRRLHTSRPYQERLLNMAEARREIVTALKFHRASMKQHANHEQPNQHQEDQDQQEGKMMFMNSSISSSSRRNIYSSNHLENNNLNSYSTTFPTPPPHLIYPSPQNHFIKNENPIGTTPIMALPNQTLGLNLNFHDFNNMINYSDNPSSSIYSSSSSSSSNTFSNATHEGLPSLGTSQQGLPMSADVVTNGPNSTTSSSMNMSTHEERGLMYDDHATLDEEEMAKLRSIGEQHQMEWNDTLNLVRSAWWFKFLKNLDIDKADQEDNIDAFHPFDELMEFPDWLTTPPNEHFNDHYSSDDYFQDPALPCMEIGEIEEMDEDWLA